MKQSLEKRLKSLRSQFLDRERQSYVPRRCYIRKRQEHGVLTGEVATSKGA